MSYKDRLQEAMDLAKFDRKTLAEKIGVSVQAVGMAVTGNSKAFSAENSAKAAKAMHVDHYWLATGEGSPRPPALLSDEQIQIAREYGRLDEYERQTFRALLLVARRHASDERVSETIKPAPALPKTEQIKREKEKRQD